MSRPSSTEDTDTQYVSGTYVERETLEERGYQSELVNAAKHQSTLIALPTGTGKTAVAARLIAHRLETVGGKAVMLAPTQPLVNQHAEFFREVLAIPEHEIRVFTGDIRPDKREDVWDEAVSVIVATPQVIENDLIGNRYDMRDVSHLVFDECHRATGGYAYNYIGERYHGNATDALSTGLSASPGSSKDSILEVCSNIGVTNVEVITEEDDSLQKYLHDIQIEYNWIDVPDELLQSRDMVQKSYVKKLKRLKSMGVLDSARKTLSITKLMEARGKIQQLIDDGESQGYKAQSIHAEAMKLNHGWQTIETQSPHSAVSYFEGIFSEGRSSNGSKAAERIAASPQVRQAVTQLREYDDIHPKSEQVRIETARTLMNDGQVLLFTESRETASELVEFLDSGEMNPTRFVGQTNKEDDPGMTQTEQEQTLDKFRAGEYNILVSTSVAEEGIDIPAVDLVLFYEPVPNAVRTVQRRGRTGRETQGRVVVLIATNTGDETAYYVSKSKEEKMEEQMGALKQMEDELRDELREEQLSLEAFGERELDTDSPVVYVDSRETRSSVGRELDRMSQVTVEIETLSVGDYVVSNRIAVERKELDDFVDSLTAGERDLFTQVSELTEAYERPVLIVEGGDGISDLYGRAQIDEEAVRSALQSITVDFNVSLLFTDTEAETAKNIRSLARREQQETDTDINPHANKRTDSVSDTQEYVVSSIPDVGPVTAHNLLTELGSISQIITASRDTLTTVDGVGDKTAEQIVSLVTSEYDAS